MWAFIQNEVTLSLPSMIMLRKAVKPKLLGAFISICAANGSTAVAVGIAGYLKEYTNELHTSNRPYVWQINIPAQIPETDRTQKEREVFCSGDCCRMGKTASNRLQSTDRAYSAPNR